MRIKRNKRFQTEIPVGSMSDIMFFLLLFFLIISTLANPNVIKLTLPKAPDSETTKNAKLTLTIDENKRYFLDKSETSFEQLESTLAGLMATRTDKTIVLRVPYNLQAQDMVDVLQIGSRLQLNIVIATDKK